jgi:hypothetical protein
MVLFLIIIFFNFILQHWVDWELDILICFDLLYIGLSWSNDLDREFSKLTGVYPDQSNKLSSQYLKK